MRILHVDSGREMRGGQWQALRLHQGLIAAGHESLLLAPGGSPMLEAARKRGLACAELRALGFERASRGFDLVHAHDARSHTMAALLSRSPFVVSRRVAFAPGGSLASRWKYRRATLYLAVSRFVAGQLERAGVTAESIAIVYDGIPVPAGAASGDAILAPWTPDPAKGMRLAERAAALAGVAIEFSKDLEADLPRARVLVYLSKSEGLGSGILLGMAHGVTVIASDTGGIPELIEDGVNGILVPNDAEAVAAAFGRIDRRLGAAARHTVMERFTEAQMVRATERAYERALSA